MGFGPVHRPWKKINPASDIGVSRLFGGPEHRDNGTSHGGYLPAHHSHHHPPPREGAPPGPTRQAPGDQPFPLRCYVMSVIELQYFKKNYFEETNQIHSEWVVLKNLKI
jgi:hypothetical protein